MGDINGPQINSWIADRYGDDITCMASIRTREGHTGPARNRARHRTEFRDCARQCRFDRMVGRYRRFEYRNFAACPNDRISNRASCDCDGYRPDQVQCHTEINLRRSLFNLGAGGLHTFAPDHDFIFDELSRFLSVKPNQFAALFEIFRRSLILDN